MQGFKKTLVALLAVTMVLSLVGTAFAAIPEDVAGTKYEDAAVRLMALGVFKGDDKGNFNPDAQITRAEAVAIIIRALGLEQSSELMKGVTKFADVNADPGLQWATGVINIAVSAGIVDGYPNGQFGGRDPVKYEELAKMILYALNYGITVEGGVWPTAVLAKADDLEMLKGISVVAGAPIVRGLAAKMLDNSLDINSLKQTGYGDLKQFEETGATMLEKMGYDEVEGRVVAIPEVENALDDDEVVIEVTKVNGEALKDSKEETYAELESVDVQGLFGLKVRAWVNDDDEVVFVQKKTADKDIYNDTVSKNYEKGNKLELVVLDDDVTFADDATIYVNYKKAKLSELKEGYFGRFVQDKNKVVFANVFNFSTNEGVVTKVDDKRISYFKFDDTERILNLTKADSITVFNPDLTKADFEDIEKDSVIAWWKSSDDYYIVLVNEKVEGELTKVQSGKVFLDGKGYNMKQNQASYSLNEDDDIKEWLGVPGDLDDLADEEAVALLNLKGHVRHLRGAVDVVSGTQYGIVTTSTSDSKITVFTKDGEEVTYDLDKRSDWGVLRDAPAGTYYYGSGTDLGYYILSYKVKADESIAESDSPVGVKYAVSVKGAKPESGGISFKLHANAKADWGKVGKAEKGDRFIKLDNNDAKKYYIDSKTIIMRAIKSTTKLELDPTLVKWDDFKDLVLEKNDPENMAVVFGEAGKDAKAIIFVHADFAGVTDDTYYGVISDTPGKKGGDWYAEIDTFEEGVVDYKLAKSGSDLKKGDLVEFEINFKGEADLKTVATTTKEVKGVDGNYRLLNSDWYRIEDGVVVYEWNQVDKKLGDKAVLSDIQKGDSIKFFDKADKVIKVAILYKGEVVDEDDDVGEGVVTYIDATSFRVDNKTAYFTTDKTILRDKNDVILTTGKDLTAKLAIGDQVDVKATGIDANEVKIVKKASEFALADAIKAANKALTDHVAAGGKATNAEYKAVEAALEAKPQVTATITSATTTLNALTKDIKDAKAAQEAYLAAGKYSTDAVYKAVDTALAADPQVKANIIRATSALEAATDTASDLAIVNKELAKITDPLVLPGDTAASQTAIQTAVEALVDTTKVTVSVAGSTPWAITLTSTSTTASTASKTVAITNEETLVVKAEIDKLKDITLPVGSAATQTVIEGAVKALVDLNKVVVTSPVSQQAGTNKFDVKLTAKGGTYNETKTITVSSADVNAAKVALTLEVTNPTSATATITLPATEGSANVTWSDGTNPQTGTYTTPARTTATQTVTLTATITKGVISETATFTVTIPAGTDAITVVKAQ